MLWWGWEEGEGDGKPQNQLRFLWYTKTILPVIKTLAGRAHQTNYAFLRHNCCLFLCYLSTHLLIFSSTHSACLLPLNQKERTNTHICISLEQKGRNLKRVFLCFCENLQIVSRMNGKKFCFSAKSQMLPKMSNMSIQIVTKNVQYVYPNCLESMSVQNVPKLFLILNRIFTFSTSCFFTSSISIFRTELKYVSVLFFKVAGGGVFNLELITTVRVYNRDDRYSYSCFLFLQLDSNWLRSSRFDFFLQIRSCM